MSGDIVRTSKKHDEGWVGIDLDGTLAYYENWVSINHIGPPIPEMAERVKKWHAEGVKMKIFTARMHGHNLAKGVDVETPIQRWCLQYLGFMLPITNVKDFGMIRLYDDRCVQVEANTGRLIGE